MREVKQKNFCKQCQKRTLHVIRESALEIEYECLECEGKQEVVKTFF